MALGVTKKGQSGGKSMVHRKVSAKKVPPPVSSDSSEDDEDEEDVDQRKMESSSSEGSSSDSDSSSEESLKFDDGLDEQLQGDEEDQKKLSLMNEKEREAEMYNRYAADFCFVCLFVVVVVVVVVIVVVVLNSLI